MLDIQNVLWYYRYSVHNARQWVLFFYAQKIPINKFGQVINFKSLFFIRSSFFLSKIIYNKILTLLSIVENLHFKMRRYSFVQKIKQSVFGHTLSHLNNIEKFTRFIKKLSLILKKLTVL